MLAKTTLTTYLPEHFTVIKDFSSLLNSCQGNVDTLTDLLDQYEKQMIVASANSETISVFENLYSISPKATDNLDLRRFRIQNRMQEHSPFTERHLHKHLSTLCGENGYKLKSDFKNYAIDIYVDLPSRDKKDDVILLLRRALPCNLTLNVYLLYNQHLKLETKTHSQLKAYTHHHLREEILQWQV